MKQSALSCGFIGYLVFSTSTQLIGAELLTKSCRPLPVASAPLTIVFSTPEEVRSLRLAAPTSDLPTIVSPASAQGVPAERAQIAIEKQEHSVKQEHSERQASTPEFDLLSTTTESIPADVATPRIIQSTYQAPSEPEEAPKAASEHDAHQPLRLPEIGGVPDVDLSKDPIYQELLKVFKGAMKEPGSTSAEEDATHDSPSDREKDRNRDRSKAKKSSNRKERHKEDDQIASDDDNQHGADRLESKLLDAPYHAAEDLLKVARSLEKPAKRLEKLDQDNEAAKLRKAIAKIRSIVSDLMESDPE